MVVDERHLDVELGELRLPVGAEVLVAEAASDLKVTIEPRHHQQLLIQLRRLGQRVEMPRVDPAGDQEVARPLGSAPTQDRGLDLEKSQVRHCPPHELGHTVSQNEDLLHGGAAQVEVAICEAQLLVGLRPVHLEGRRRSGVIHSHLAGARTSMPPVFSFGFSLPGSRGATIPLTPTTYSLRSSLPLGLKALAGIRLEDDLGNAVAIAEVNEGQTAEVPSSVHPAVQDHRFPDVFAGQFTARMRSFVEHEFHQKNRTNSGERRRAATILRPAGNRQGIEDWDNTRRRPGSSPTTTESD